MFCGGNSGGWKRRVRDTGETPRDLPDCNQRQRTLDRTGQLSPFYSTCLPRAQITASSTPITSRPHSTHGKFSSSLGYFFTLCSSAFLSVFSGKGKRAAEFSVVRGIEGEREELQLPETMKSGGGMGSEKKKYSTSPADYRLLEEVGNGATATVYRALYIPYNEIVAIKCLDLDLCNSNIDGIRREAQTMSLAFHPNMIQGYCSFVIEQYLWFVMPFMAEGSCFHLMKFAYPDGFEEHVIGSILKETLKALEYLHKHGHIHRDVKAGNILLDSSGAVKLSDFGVTACMFDKGDRQHSRNTFVGTPCWMAPEVMQPEGGYDFKADIWSFGITALELAHGHAPFSKYPPMKVLLMTLQNAPPGLDYDRDKKFSKSFKEMVAICLVKDQTKRPTAEKLLKHSFFKNTKPLENSMKSLLVDLPPLWQRVKMLQLKDAEQLALKQMPTSEQEALSQTQYQRGVSAWNFDIEDLKVQASLILDDENIDETEKDGGSLRNFTNIKFSKKNISIGDNEGIFKTEGDGGSLSSSINNKETNISSSTLEKPLSAYEISHRDEGENQIQSERYMPNGRKSPNLSSPLMLPNHAFANNFFASTQLLRGFGDYPEDMSRENAVQIKGRFSVKSENVDIVKDLLRNLLKSMQDNDLVSAFQTEIPLHTPKPENDVLVKTAITQRELLLLVKISELQDGICRLTGELAAARSKHTQLLQELNTAVLKRNGEKL